MREIQRNDRRNSQACQSRVTTIGIVRRQALGEESAIERVA